MQKIIFTLSVAKNHFKHLSSLKWHNFPPDSRTTRIIPSTWRRLERYMKINCYGGTKKENFLNLGEYNMRDFGLWGYFIYGRIFRRMLISRTVYPNEGVDVTGDVVLSDLCLFSQLCFLIPNFSRGNCLTRQSALISENLKTVNPGF